MEFRTRSRHVPTALFPAGEVRVWLGDPSNAKERRELAAVRDTLREVARAGDWDVLARVRDGEITPQAVHATFQRRGVAQYREALRPPADVPTLAQAFDAFLPTVQNPKTREVYTTVSRAIMRGLGSDRLLTDVTEVQVEEMLAGLVDQYSAGYRQKLKTVGSSLFTWWLRGERARARVAKRRPVMTEHPFRLAKSVPTPTTRHRFLTRDEYRALLDVTEPSIRAMYAVAVWAGLRAQELLHLRLEDVDLPKVIRIQPRPGWSPKGWPKSTRSVRDIPVHRTELLPMLEEHAQIHAGEVYFFPNPRTGQRWTYSVWRRQVERDVIAAGMDYGASKVRGVVTHTFRHTLASWMAQEDVQLLKIARILGNTPEICARHYSHLLPQDLDETIQRL